MYKPLAIANFFITKSIGDKIDLTPMKLVKLLFIAHGWYLGLVGRPLMTEAVQAWKHGPVVMSIYHTFKKYRDQQVERLEPEGDLQNFDVAIIADPVVIKFLNEIWSIYKDYSGIELSKLTHKPGSPWDITWNKNRGKDKQSTFIPNDLIATFYQHERECQKLSYLRPINKA